MVHADESMLFSSTTAIEQHFLCGTVYYAAQGGSNFKFVDETLERDHSNESY